MNKGNNPWTAPFEEVIVPTPEFVKHCMEAAGQHLKEAEKWRVMSQAEFDAHITLANAYANVLKAIR